MPEQLVIRVEGLEEAQRKIKLLEKRVRNKVASQGLRAGARPIFEEASKRAPVRTGTLRASLKIRVNPEKRRGDQSIAVLVGKGFFKGPTFYGGFVHFGHRIGKRPSAISRLQSKKSRVKGRIAKSLVQVRINKIDTRKRVEGRPFLFQAYDSRKQEAAQIAQSSILAGIDHEVAALRSAGSV